MNTHFFRKAVLSLVVLVTIGCANGSFYHRHIIAGQVVESDDGEAVVCIGTDDGAETGQVLDAYRAVMRKGVVEEGESRWNREYVGKVRIEKIIDEHFATVKVVDGNVSQNDIVELNR